MSGSEYELPPPVFHPGKSSRVGTRMGHGSASLTPGDTLFFSAFFGGTIAIILLSVFDSRSLGRLRMDAWRYGLVAVVSAVLLATNYYLAVVQPMPAWMQPIIGETDFRFAIYFGITHLYPIILLIVFWWPYRWHYKRADTRRTDRNAVRRRVWPTVMVSALIEIALFSSLK